MMGVDRPTGLAAKKQSEGETSELGSLKMKREKKKKKKKEGNP